MTAGPRVEALELRIVADDAEAVHPDELIVADVHPVRTGQEYPGAVLNDVALDDDGLAVRLSRVVRDVGVDVDRALLSVPDHVRPDHRVARCGARDRDRCHALEIVALDARRAAAVRADGAAADVLEPTVLDHDALGVAGADGVDAAALGRLLKGPFALERDAPDGHELAEADALVRIRQRALAEQVAALPTVVRPGFELVRVHEERDGLAALANDVYPFRAVDEGLEAGLSVGEEVRARGHEKRPALCRAGVERVLERLRLVRTRPEVRITVGERAEHLRSEGVLGRGQPLAGSLEGQDDVPGRLEGLKALDGRLEATSRDDAGARATAGVRLGHFGQVELPIGRQVAALAGEKPRADDLTGLCDDDLVVRVDDIAAGVQNERVLSASHGFCPCPCPRTARMGG